jgi:hypothetical protein
MAQYSIVRAPQEQDNGRIPSGSSNGRLLGSRPSPHEAGSPNVGGVWLRRVGQIANGCPHLAPLPLWVELRPSDGQILMVRLDGRLTATGDVQQSGFLQGLGVRRMAEGRRRVRRSLGFGDAIRDSAFAGRNGCTRWITSARTVLRPRLGCWRGTLAGRQRYWDRLCSRDGGGSAKALSKGGLQAR